MYCYINFYFRDLVHINNTVTGIFDAPDWDVRCRFKWVVGEEDCEIWDNNQPKEEIKPIPVWWLVKKLRENGKLNSLECKISY